MDHNPQGRRPHYHRGRRGTDRRGGDRRAPQQAQDQPPRQTADQVDVEQIMRDIRTRIAQRHGIELSTQQIQELAARRLDAILDPRNINPALLEQLRRGAAAAPEIAPPSPDPGYSFEDTTLYDSHRGVLRFIRRLLNPILKLFFNPNPLIHALHTQARLNSEAAAREVQRERMQAEWNALHYELLQRLVTEVSRVSIEMQALALRVESLSAKVDFNDRRVRSIEASVPPGRGQQPRQQVDAPPAAVAVSAAETTAAEAGGTEGATSDGARRRRRRRRGRRGSGAALETAAGGDTATAADDAAAADTEPDEGDEEIGAEPAAAEPVMSPALPQLEEPRAVAPDQAPPPEQPTPPHDEPNPQPVTNHPDSGPDER